MREFAVPPEMIKAATARRLVRDWAGACAAARVDVDLDLRAVARRYGHHLAGRLRDDLRHLAPDLLRWHLPRIGPDGLLRPGLTVLLAHYPDVGCPGGTLWFVARTPPAWADAGQRFSLALWDGTRSDAGPHPHPRPDRRFRLDLHRHLWDARRTHELRARAGADLPVGGDIAADRLSAGPDAAGRCTAGPVRADPADGLTTATGDPSGSPAVVPAGYDCATHRWAAEAAILLRAEGRDTGRFAVRLGGRRRLVLELTAGGELRDRTGRRAAQSLPVLPDAATWLLPDLALLRAGLLTVDRLHPLVAAALAPDRPPAGAGSAPTDGPGPRQTPDTGPPATPGTGPRPVGGTGTRLVDCRGARHRIGLVDGILVPLDHDPAEIRREELLAALTGTPLPCLRAIDEAHRHPERLTEIRARLDHGDTAGAVAAVERLLGPDAVLRGGALRDELATAAARRVQHGLFRSGLAEVGLTGLDPTRAGLDGTLSCRTARPRGHRERPRHAHF
ncbi:hypothetical protein GCM10027605_22560 [Micromonospora zhanjiangensis]